MRETLADDMGLSIVVDQVHITFPDAQPFIDDNGRTQVPVRFVSEALGADIDWDGDTRTVTVSLNNNTVKLTIGDSNYVRNNVRASMDTEAQIIDDRTFVPIRFVSEALDAEVDWDAAIKTVYIYTKEEVVDTSGTTEVAGFTVPIDSTLSFAAGGESSSYIIAFVFIPEADYAQQLEDFRGVLTQTCDEGTVDEVIAYLSQKQERVDDLELKVFFDVKTNRDIVVLASRAGATSIAVNYMSK